MSEEKGDADKEEDEHEDFPQTKQQCNCGTRHQGYTLESEEQVQEAAMQEETFAEYSLFLQHGDDNSVGEHYRTEFYQECCEEEEIVE